MTFICVYSAIILLFLIIFLCTGKYKKGVFDNLDKKENPFRFIYGMSAWILDFIDKKIYRLSYAKISKRIEKIKVNNYKKEDTYIYMVSRISISIIAFILIIIFGDLICLNNTFSKTGNVKSIFRKNYGEGEKVYELEAKFKDGYRQNVKIKLPEKANSYDDVKLIIENSYQSILKNMLNGNQSINNITGDVKLIYSLDNNVTVDWNLNNTLYIDYGGKILWENMGNVDKVSVDIEVTLSLDTYSKTYNIPLTINKAGRKKSEIIDESIEKYIDEYTKSDKEVELMNSINDEEVEFVEKKRKSSIIYIFIGVIMALVLYMIKGKELQDYEDKRRKQLEIDYVTMVNKITILHSAGMTILAAWDKVISDYEKNKSTLGMRYAYEEMKYARQKMKNGYSECQAYLDYGKRCGIHSYIKFGNLLEQNIRKGTKGLSEILESEVNDAYEERKALARKKGEEAGTKLLLPMGIMLVISMAIIIIPAFLSMGI